MAIIITITSQKMLRRADAESGWGLWAWYSVPSSPKAGTVYYFYHNQSVDGDRGAIRLYNLIVRSLGLGWRIRH